MRRGLDFDKAEAALKRAAEKATHGTREERSGRFLPSDQWYSAAMRESGSRIMADKKHELRKEITRSGVEGPSEHLRLRRRRNRPSKGLKG